MLILCLIVAPLAASINTDQIIDDAYTTTAAIIIAILYLDRIQTV